MAVMEPYRPTGSGPGSYQVLVYLDHSAQEESNLRIPHKLSGLNPMSRIQS